MEESEICVPDGEKIPELASLKGRLCSARQLLDEGKLRDAAVLSSEIVGVIDRLMEVHEFARDLYEQAQSRLNKKLKKALVSGDKTRKEGREEDARKEYQAALELDPGNDHACQALLEMDRALAASLFESELIKLRAGLKNRRNFEILEEAIHIADTLKAEGKLPINMVNLLEAARMEYYAEREIHDRYTDMMRYGDLNAKKEARDNIRELVLQGNEKIFDGSQYCIRNIIDVLQEADKLYEELSAETAQYELSRINSLHPGFLRTAKIHLQSALEKPFFEQHTRILENKLADVEKLLQGQEAAEGLLNQARQESDALKILDLVSQARAVFNDLPGINERLETSRRTARDTMAAGMRSHYSQAEMLVNTARFSSGKVKYDIYMQARHEVTASEELLAQWPESEKPKELLDLTQTGEQILKRVDEEESLTREFEGKVDTILKQVGDDSTRAAGMALFEEIRSDLRFVKFPDMRELNGMMDQYREIREQFEEARLAQQHGNWLRVYAITKEISDSGRAGQWLEEVETLLKEAWYELSIQEALQALEKDYIQEANRVLSKLLKSANQPDREELERRLRNELARINQAIDDTPLMQMLFDQVKILKESPTDENQIQAQRIYRYVGGNPSEPRQEAWPEYRLSLRTADARREARELGEKLRGAWLPGLEEAYSRRELTPPSKSEISRLVVRARWLREADMLEGGEQRIPIRLTEMSWELQQISEQMQ